jgi:bla regulator protein blaR1
MTFAPSLWLRDLAAFALQFALVAMVGGLIPSLLRLRIPRARLAYWQGVLALGLVLPFIEKWRPDAAPAAASSAGEITIRMGTLIPAAHTGSWEEAILLALLLGFVGRLLWIALGLRRLRIYRNSAQPLAEWPAPVHAAHRLVPSKAVLFLTSQIQSPSTFGLGPAVVLLPRSFTELPAGAQQAIACHEFLHARRRDWAWNLFEELVLAVLWFHPAAWWLVRNIRLSREQTVDAQVIGLTLSRRDYLNALLEIARHEVNPRRLPAPLFLHESQLAQRVALILKEVTMSRSRLLASLLAASLLLAAAGAAAARAFPLKSSQAPGRVAFTAGLGHQLYSSIAWATTGTAAPAIPHHVSVKQLKRVKVVMPHYPVAAKRSKVQGEVDLDVTLNRKGAVMNIRVISGPQPLVRSAIDAVKQWRYAPSPLLPAHTAIKINYTLEETSPKNPPAGAGSPHSTGTK